MKYKKALVGLLVFLILILIKLLFTFITNESVKDNYESGKYREDLIKILKTTNLNEPYIVYYNEGNILNREKKYDEALISYQKSLNKNPPDQRKCDVYINITITMIQMINTDQKDELLEKLKEARENLYNNHCADENNDSGKSKNAEDTEDAIREMEEKIKNSSSNGNDDNQDEDENQETEEDKSLEEELQKTNKEANENRQKELQEYKNLGDYQYYHGKSW